jgi:hypothetical protein
MGKQCARITGPHNANPVSQNSFSSARYSDADLPDVRLQQVVQPGGPGPFLKGLRCALITKIAVFLECLVDDVFQPLGKVRFNRTGGAGSRSRMA